MRATYERLHKLHGRGGETFEEYLERLTRNAIDEARKARNRAEQHAAGLGDDELMEALADAHAGITRALRRLEEIREGR